MITFIKLKIVKENGEIVARKASKSKRRILHFIKANNCRDCLYKILVKYSDGMTNEGLYGSKKELLSALDAFSEL